MYQEVERQLHRNFDELAPDLLGHILAAEPEEILSEEELFSETDRISEKNRETSSFAYRRYTRLAVAAVLVCMLTLGYHIWNRSCTGSVTIEADSSVRLSLNRANQIVSVELEDPSLLNADELEGQSLEDGLDMVLDKLTEDAGSADDSAISIRYEGASGIKSVNQTIQKSADRYSSKKKIDIEASSQSVSDSAKNSAREEKVSQDKVSSRVEEPESPAEQASEDKASAREAVADENAIEEIREEEASTEEAVADENAAEEIGEDEVSPEAAVADECSGEEVSEDKASAEAATDKDSSESAETVSAQAEKNKVSAAETAE